MSANNINAFVIDIGENKLFAGTLTGQLLTIGIESFEILDKRQVTYGAINVIAAHPLYPYIAIYGEDNWLAIFKYSSKGSIKLLHMIRVRRLAPKDDPYNPGRSTTQALSFHPIKLRLAGHGGSAALFELAFDDKHYRIIHCTRLHGGKDFVTACYVSDKNNRLLSGTNMGEIILSDEHNIIKSWELKNENKKTIHWFEPLSVGQFLIASDAGRVFKLNLMTDTIIESDIFARDHMEHTHYNAISKKAFASSFDRNIYEINPNTLTVNKIAWTSPYKLRWIKTLQHSPNIMIVQCRNGALYKISLGGKKQANLLKTIKLTPYALWSAVVNRRNSSLIASGEGGHYYQYSHIRQNCYDRCQIFREKKIPLSNNKRCYTKRIAISKDSKFTAFARTDGQVIILEKQKKALIVNLHSPLRDIVFRKDAACLWAATEDGNVYEINFSDSIQKKIIYSSDSPIWAIAFNADSNILAIAHRLTNVILLDLDNKSPNKVINGKHIETIREFYFIKRLLWADANQLLIGISGGILKYDMKKDEVTTYLDERLSNTVENFGWDVNKRYLVLINYTRELYLCEYATGEIVDVHASGVDYAKSIVFLDKLKLENAHWGDFVVFGRHGKPIYYRINNDKIISYGHIWE